MIEQSLFAEYPPEPNHGKRTRKVREPVETEPVIVDHRWRGVAANQTGVVHALVSHTEGIRGLVSYCNVSVVPHTFTDGEVVQGCGECIKRGAHHRRPVAA